jgi:N-acetylmuramic acid 6-phosphate etherase
MSKTESPNPRFADAEDWPLVDAVEAMLEGQMAALASIKSQTHMIAGAAQAASARLSQGGRIVYAGAGTSGRVAVQDGVELGPTFGWPADRLVYLLAGGVNAMMRSAEGAEDDITAAQSAIAANAVTPKDVVIAVAASGRTPFAVAALQAARAAGALTIAIANNADAPLLTSADFPILAETGSEFIAGSTRMKAGTAQKVILNLLSTAIMLRLGKVYRGLMVDMVVSNEKLKKRACGIVATLAQCDEAIAKAALTSVNYDIKLAVLIARGHAPLTATEVLAAHHGQLRAAVAALEVGQ